MRAQGASLTKTDGKIDEYQGTWERDKNYPTIHCMLDKTMIICENHLT
jgi:hypothetical protein